MDMGKPTTWGEVEALLKELVPGSSLHFGRAEGTPGTPTAPKELNLATEFGFLPKYGIGEGLRETVEWFRNGQR
jgi:nucleoside-diphosphate-sugar epimerase